MFDTARRRLAQRKGGRYRGVVIYLAADDLAAAGYDPDESPIYYRLFPNQRGAFRLQLYRTPN